MRTASLKHRLYLPDADHIGGAELTREQSHYLTNVLRLRSGQTIAVFNGSGSVFAAQISRLDRKGATLELTGLLSHHAPNAPRLTLAIALLKSQAMDTALQKATELGVDRIQLLTSERTNVSLSDERLDKRLAHWRGVITGACEQSGRSWLPTLHAPLAFSAYLSELTDSETDSAFLLEPKGESAKEYGLGDTTIVIGPEGGWNDSELAAANHAGVRSRKLGTTVLRAETAAIAALSAVQQSWEWPARH